MSDAKRDFPVRPVRWAKLRAWRSAPEWAYSWLVFWSQQWSFLKILDAAGKLAILVAVAQVS